MTVQNLYTKYLNGEITKQKFLYEVRRDQNLTMISPSNSFDDVVKILKNKSIISEKAAKESTGKQEVEIIAKTIDMVNPYEYNRGMEYELNIMDVPATSGDLSEENILKAQKKVLANLTKNPQYYCNKIHGKGEVSEDWVEATKKEIEKIGKGKKNIMREEYSAVLGLPNGKYFAIDADWEDEYQGKNGMFFTISGNNIYDKDGESIQSSPREFLSQFKPEEILKVKVIREGLEEATDTEADKDMVRKLMAMYETEPSKFERVHKQAQVQAKTSEDVKFKHILSLFDRAKAAALQSLANQDRFEADREGMDEATRPGYHPDGTPKSNDEMSDDEREAFYNDSDFLDEHGQYADRVADVNADSSPLKEREKAIYEKYAEKTGIPMENLMAMVREAKAKKMEEAIALKDKAGNTQYAKDSTEAANIERAAKAKGVILTKTNV